MNRFSQKYSGPAWTITARGIPRKAEREFLGELGTHPDNLTDIDQRSGSSYQELVRSTEVLSGVTWIESAQIRDAAGISAVLLANWADRGLFQDSASGISRNITDFVVARNEAGQIVGCAGVHRDPLPLAQLYSVAVAPQCQGRGVGGELIAAAMQSATLSGVERLWLATIKPDYFSRYAFRPMSRWVLPTSVLLRQLRRTLRQPTGRIVPALIGGYTFMVCDL
jgi:amino-acid N-acetyltransferase